MAMKKTLLPVRANNKIRNVCRTAGRPRKPCSNLKKSLVENKHMRYFEETLNSATEAIHLALKR